MAFSSHFPALRPAMVLRNPSLGTLDRAVCVLNRSEAGSLVLPQPAEKSIGPLESVTVSPAPNSGGKSVAAVTDPHKGNPSPSWSEVVTHSRDPSHMKFS